MNQKQAFGVTALFSIAIFVLLFASINVKLADGKNYLFDIIIILLGLWKVSDIISWFYQKITKK